MYKQVIKGLYLLLALFVSESLQGCPSVWYSTAGYGMPGCITMMTNQSDTVSWAYALHSCQTMDSRGRLPTFSSSDQVALFKMMANTAASSFGKIVLWLGAYQTLDTQTWMWINNMEVNGSWQAGQPNGTTLERCVGFDLGSGDSGYSDFPCNSKLWYACQITNDKAPGLVSVDNVDEGLLPGYASCVPPWVQVGGNCYQIPSISQPTDATSAQSECSSLDPQSTLPYFNNPKDWESFLRYISSITEAEHQDFWLGTARTADRSAFANPNGLFPYSYWQTDQPDDGTGDENCVKSSEINGYVWQDVSCTEQAFTICQISFSPGTINTALSETTPLPQYPCPSNWVATAQYGMPGCLIMQPGLSADKTDSVGWGYAQDVCQQLDSRAHLVILHDASQFNTYKMAASMAGQSGQQGYIWFGGYQPVNATGTWIWLDGTQVTGPWQAGQPNGSTVERCLAYHSGDDGYSDVPCGIQAFYPCQITDLTILAQNTSNVGPGPASTTPSCVFPWIQVGGQCYQIAPVTQPTDYSTAQAACSSLDSASTLPQFHNWIDWDAFVRYVGMNVSTADHEPIWIGATRSGAPFNMIDGTWYYSNWMVQQPSNEANENCVSALDLQGYGWNDVDCSTKAYAICQISSIANTALTIPPTTPPPQCPSPSGSQCPDPSKCWASTALYGIQGCMFMQPGSSQNKTDNVTWGYAQDVCQQLDPRAHLLTLTNANQFAAYKIASSALSGGQTAPATAIAWVGAYQPMNATGTWIWMDGSPVTGPWQANQPDGGTSERCLGYKSGDDGFSDYPCSTQAFYACQITDLSAASDKPINVNSALTPLTPVCNSPWVAVGGMCYQIPSTTQPVDFTSAQSVCTSLNSRSTIPQFHNAQDWDAFIRYVGANVSVADHHYLWIGATRIGSQFTMLDGTWEFSNWLAAQPTSGANENCVSAHDVQGYGWIAADCAVPGFIICQLDTTYETTTTLQTTTLTTTLLTTTPAMTTTIVTTIPPTTTLITTVVPTTIQPTTTITTTKAPTTTAQMLTTVAQTTTKSPTTTVQLLTTDVLSTVVTAIPVTTTAQRSTLQNTIEQTTTGKTTVDFATTKETITSHPITTIEPLEPVSVTSSTSKIAPETSTIEHASDVQTISSTELTSIKQNQFETVSTLSTNKLSTDLKFMSTTMHAKENTMFTETTVYNIDSFSQTNLQTNSVKTDDTSNVPTKVTTSVTAYANNVVTSDISQANAITNTIAIDNTMSTGEPSTVSTAKLVNTSEVVTESSISLTSVTSTSGNHISTATGNLTSVKSTASNSNATSGSTSTLAATKTSISSDTKTSSLTNSLTKSVSSNNVGTTKVTFVSSNMSSSTVKAFLSSISSNALLLSAKLESSGMASTLPSSTIKLGSTYSTTSSNATALSMKSSQSITLQNSTKLSSQSVTNTPSPMTPLSLNSAKLSSQSVTNTTTRVTNLSTKTPQPVTNSALNITGSSTKSTINTSSMKSTMQASVTNMTTSSWKSGTSAKTTSLKSTTGSSKSGSVLLNTNSSKWISAETSLKSNVTGTTGSSSKQSAGTTKNLATTRRSTSSKKIQQNTTKTTPVSKPASSTQSASLSTQSDVSSSKSIISMTISNITCTRSTVENATAQSVKVNSSKTTPIVSSKNTDSIIILLGNTTENASDWEYISGYSSKGVTINGTSVASKNQTDPSMSTSNSASMSTESTSPSTYATSSLTHSSSATSESTSTTTIAAAFAKTAEPAHAATTRETVKNQLITDLEQKTKQPQNVPKLPPKDVKLIKIDDYWAPADWLLAVLTTLAAVPIFCCVGACIYKFLNRSKVEHHPFYHD